MTQVLAQDSGVNWAAYNVDSAEGMVALPADSIDLSVTSPAFLSLYVYSASDRDLGNNQDAEKFFRQYGFIIDELLRVTKPGRLACVHVQQVAAMLSRDGYIGLKDFRGDVIRAHIERGWIYHGEVCIWKNAQAQAVRTKAKALLFVQLHKDSSWSRPALADYILLFRKPGENQVPVVPNIDNETWISWASPIWFDIHESDTLNYTAGRAEDDERHLAPLQLGTIERCIRLWSNPGEVVLDYFGGIGSTPYVAIKNERKAVMMELKPEYYRTALKNLKEAERLARDNDLFSWASLDINNCRSANDEPLADETVAALRPSQAWERKLLADEIMRADP